jgi:hypothetical protein
MYKDYQINTHNKTYFYHCENKKIFRLANRSNFHQCEIIVLNRIASRQKTYNYTYVKVLLWFHMKINKNKLQISRRKQQGYNKRTRMWSDYVIAKIILYCIYKERHLATN